MANESLATIPSSYDSTCYELVAEAYIAMEAIDRARLLATTAAAVPEITSGHAHTIPVKIGHMMEELHNDIDVMRERLEGPAEVRP